MEVRTGMHHHAGTCRVPWRHHTLEFEADPMVCRIHVQEELTTGIGPDQRIHDQQILRTVDIEIGHHRGVSAVRTLDGISRGDVRKGQVPVVVIQEVRVRREEILIGHVQVALPIVVMVDEGGAPTHAEITHVRSLGDVREHQGIRGIRLGTRIDEEVVRQVVRDVQVEITIVVQICRVHPHALCRQVQPPGFGLIGEVAYTVIDVQLVRLIGIVREVQIEVAVILDVQEQGPHPDEIVGRS